DSLPLVGFHRFISIASISFSIHSPSLFRLHPSPFIHLHWFVFISVSVHPTQFIRLLASPFIRLHSSAFIFSPSVLHLFSICSPSFASFHLCSPLFTPIYLIAPDSTGTYWLEMVRIGRRWICSTSRARSPARWSRTWR